MNIILLSGGSGTRLWPLSNETMSKQFLRLLRNDRGEKESMVQRVFRQLKETKIDANIVIATGKSQVESIRFQLGEDTDLVVEPERRNTYPAILLSAAYLKYRKQVKDDESVLVLPVDPYTDNAYFETLHRMDEVIQSGRSQMVLMGIVPTYPSEKYGYIICEEDAGDVRTVTRFQEKPDLETANRLLAQGAFWNAGVFGFKLSYIMDILHQELKADSFEEVLEQFPQIKKNSFDYEVVEKAGSISMVPYRGEWKDLGTWNTLTEEMPENHGNVVTGEGNENVSIVNVTDKPVVVLGLKDAVVVSSAEGVLVSDKGASSYLRPYVEGLNERPLFEEKRWGKYKVLDQEEYEQGQKTLVKRLSIRAGKAFSLQLHHHRDEIWIIVSGRGLITIGEKTEEMSAGDVVKISKGEKHKAVALEDMEIIEVQIGDLLSEEDIVRFDYQ